MVPSAGRPEPPHTVSRVGMPLGPQRALGPAAPKIRPPPERICPECGFDLSPGQVCGACGYDPMRDLSRSHRYSPVSWVPLLYSVALVVLTAVLFLGIDLPHARPGNSPVPSPAASANPPAVASQADKAREPPQPSQEGQRTRFSKAIVLTPGGPLGNFPLGVLERPAVDIASRNLHPPLSDKTAYLDWMRQHTAQPGAYLQARWDCAQEILALGQIRNMRVIEGFLLTPREEFCRAPRRAYENAAMPIGYGQTISGPYLVARMTDALNPQPDQRVLEVGTGSGYQSALLSELSSRVFSIEIVEALARETDQIYRRLWDTFPEYHNVRRKVDDGYYGWPEYAPFDRIIVTCGIDHIPPELLRELAPEGIMVIPVGPPSGQTILRIVKHVAADGTVSLEREDIYHGQITIIFVPFTSKGGLHTE